MMIDQDQTLQYNLKDADYQWRKSKVNHGRMAGKQVRERLKHNIVANLAYSRYELVRVAIQESGFLIKDDEDLSDATFSKLQLPNLDRQLFTFAEDYVFERISASQSFSWND